MKNVIFLLSNRGRVYHIPNNQETNTIKNKKSLVELKKYSLLKNETVYDIALSGNHFCCICANNNEHENNWLKILGWGENKSFELGFMSNDIVYDKPKRIRRDQFDFEYNEKYDNPQQIDSLKYEEVIKVECGIRMTYFQTNNVLFGCGDEKNGKLGLGEIKKGIFKPTRVIVPSKLPILGVSCGMHHSIAWDLGGKLYSWGKNTHSQLGHLYQKFDPNHVEKSPIIVESVLEHRVVIGHCCINGSFIINERGNVIYWGSCLTFQENDDVDLRELQVPKKQHFDWGNTPFTTDKDLHNYDTQKDPRIIKISGWYKNFALLDLMGNVYTLGMNNEWNVLGLRGIAQPKFITKARYIDLGPDNRAIDVTCGDGFMIIISTNVDQLETNKISFTSYEVYKDLWFKILHGKQDRIKGQTCKMKLVRNVFNNA